MNTKRLPPKDQAQSQSCTKQTTAGASEYEDKVEFNAAFGWARVCKDLNNTNPNGADPREAMAVSVNEGELLQADSPLTFPKDALTIGNWQWSDPLTPKADLYRKAAYIKVPFVNDHFDSIRTALLNGQTKNQVVMAFGTWCDGWLETIIPTTQTSVVGYHAYLFIDFDTLDGVEYLVARNSYGETIGDKGFQYFPRETVNREFEKRGTGYYVFEDLTAAEIELAKQETTLGQIQRNILALWHAFMLLADTFYGRITK